MCVTHFLRHSVGMCEAGKEAIGLGRCFLYVYVYVLSEIYIFHLRILIFI